MILNKTLFENILNKNSSFFGIFLPKDVNLRSKEITIIEKNTFCSYNSLTTIILSGNKITQIEKETFLGLNKLTIIDLSKNQITQIERQTFQGLNSLTNIYLQRNKITQIEKETFQCLNNLTKINLSRNKITRLEKETFQGLNNLKHIDLHCNDFKCKFLKLSLEPSVEFLSWTTIHLINPQNEIQTVQSVNFISFNLNVFFIPIHIIFFCIRLNSLYPVLIKLKNLVLVLLVLFGLLKKKKNI